MVPTTTLRYEELLVKASNIVLSTLGDSGPAYPWGEAGCEALAERIGNVFTFAGDVLGAFADFPLNGTLIEETFNDGVTERRLDDAVRSIIHSLWCATSRRLERAVAIVAKLETEVERRSGFDRDTIAASHETWTEAKPTFGRFYEPMSAEVLEGLVAWISKRLPLLVQSLVRVERAMTACGRLDRNVRTDLQFAQDDLAGTWQYVFWQLERIARRIAAIEREFFATPEDAEDEAERMAQLLSSAPPPPPALNS